MNSTLWRKIRSKYPLMARWLKKLNKGNTYQRFFCHKCHREYEFQNIRKESLETIMNDYENYLQAKSTAINQEDPILLFLEFVDESLLEFKSKRRTNIYKESYSVDKPEDTNIGIRCMKRRTFHRMIGEIDDSYEKPLEDAWSPLLDKLNHNQLKSSELSEAGAKIKGPPQLGFFWTSRWDHIRKGLDQKGNKDDNCAFQKQFGLCHCNDNLVIVFFNLFSENEEPPYNPTLFHARDGKYYRPAWRKDYWGESINLVSLGRGAPEAIKFDTIWRPDFKDPYEVGELPERDIGLNDNQWDQVMTASRSQLIAFIQSRPNRAPK